MNTVDMNTREKVNKIHLDEMHKEAKVRQMLQQANQETDTELRHQHRVLSMRTLFEQLSALLPHHLPHRPSVHHVK